MVEMSGSKAFVEGLKRENVEMIFGVTGGAVLPICDELWGSDLRFVMARGSPRRISTRLPWSHSRGKCP
jgi:thiamine pyrophosphate-dependent acetolactate synthase large subunit-like protein